MAKTIIASFLGFLSALGIVRGQHNQATLPYKHATEQGEFFLHAFPNNIFKVTFVPSGYTTGENISDAVILKPIRVKATKDSSGRITIGNYTFLFNSQGLTVNKGKLVLLNTHASDEYRGFRFSLQPSHRYYGGGSRALPLNRNGYKFNLYNGPWYGYGEGANNLNYSVPFISTSEGYGLFFDNPSKGYMDIGATNKNIFEYGAFSGELNFYIIFGNTQQEILTNYHKLTGTQPLPPKWALGNLMSRFGYASEAQARDILGQMKQQHFPVDAIIFDLFWFGDSIKNTLGNLDWVNKQKWPDPKKMIADFRKEGVQTVLITEPYVLNTSATYEESKHLHAVDKDGKPYVMTEFYFGNGGLLDLFRKDAQNWFWNKYKKQMDIGVEGWWGDLGEPETHPPAMYHNLKDMGFKRMFKANEVHNLYGHVWTSMLFQNYAREYPRKRLFSLNRSGYAGTQRFSIFPWSGDVARSWTGFRAQLPVMLGATMSGIPYMHADAGGFAGGDGDNELYTRWLQFAVFTPIFRPHGTALYDIDPMAFSYPSEPALFPEPYRSIARDAVMMRYRLMPYNYSLAYKQAVYGEPLAAPLYYYHNDESAVAVQDQYYWGPSIMVCPVLEKGAAQRKVYLPKGQWYKWATAEAIDGDSTLQLAITQTEIPLFVKAGAIIPLANADTIRNYRDVSPAAVDFHYYPSAQSSTFSLYDDDGEDRNAIISRKFELITISAVPRKEGISFQLTSNGGGFTSRHPSRAMRIVMHTRKEYRKATVDGKDITPLREGERLIIPVSFTTFPIKVQLSER